MYTLKYTIFIQYFNYSIHQTSSNHCHVLKKLIQFLTMFTTLSESNLTSSKEIECAIEQRTKSIKTKTKRAKQQIQRIFRIQRINV